MSQERNILSLIKQRNFCFYFLLIGILIIIFTLKPNKTKNKIALDRSDTIDNLNEISSGSKRDCLDSYRAKCYDLLKKLRYPNQSLIMRPPPRMPPSYLLSRFTQHGDMPITKQWYINEVYSDSNSNDKNSRGKVVTAAEFDTWLNKVKNNEPLVYYNVELEQTMKKLL